MSESDLAQLLGLLATGAEAEQLARPLAAARETGLPAARLRVLAEATEHALRIHRTLGQHRRREAELAALFDTAGDLAALRDVDAVLRSIVRRARLLLGTDLAYLSLNDETAGDTYMRVTDGSISVRFQQVRLGMGEGLGGRVAHTAEPAATAGYLSDTQFAHTAAIDAAVADEGLVSILGVPLRLANRVIGVLYAGERDTRSFTPEEIALLTSLADHAAVALDTARLLEQTRTHHEALRRAEAAHDRLTDLVLRGGDVHDVAVAVAELLGGGIAVRDAEGAVLARTGTAPPRVPAQAVAEARASGRAVRSGRRWVCAVLAGAELLGTMVLTDRPELTEADQRLFERAGVVTALVLLLRRSVAEAENRVRGELLTDLLAGTADPDALLARAARLGVDLGRRQVVLVAESARERVGVAAARVARAAQGLAAGAVLLIPGEDPGAVARTVAAELGAAVGGPVTVGGAGPVVVAGGGALGGGALGGGALGGGATGEGTTGRGAAGGGAVGGGAAGGGAGIGGGGAGGGAAGPGLPGAGRGVADGLGGLGAAHREAQRCLRALLALGRRGEGAAVAELGFVGVLLGDRADVAGFVRDTLGAVLDYDARRGTELVRTLTEYFGHGCSPARTREALHVHVNTVTQRLERVADLLGADWQEPARALEVQLALRLHRLSG
ncbi:GAF domain-containing protein [Crossiella sp. SN42]|uniref:helix-turn-helix domain-containing protein n=1 Tax=Crossiella sp. SN42 TaxID=2944808 RepID=UPI00207C9C83|nr:GAF domain-containing protein [Crossiella sp. SN42]MCO1580631.1 GAF domain-containing protein [Crossiella sp. SN42]